MGKNFNSLLSGRSRVCSCFFVLVFFLLMTFQGLAEDSRYFPQVMDGVFGDAEYQTTFRFVNTGDDTSVTLEFFDNGGDPAGMPFQGIDGEPESLQFLLKRGETASFRTIGTGDFVTGFARFTSSPFVDGTAAFIGIDSASRVIMYETAVPSVFPAYEFTVMLDSSGDLDTGLALIPVVPGGGSAASVEEAELTLTLHDSSGEIVTEETITVAAAQKTSKYIYEIFAGAADAGEMEGSVTVSSDSLPLVAISSRQRYAPEPFPLSIPTLTIYPVAPLSHTLKGENPERLMIFAPHPDDEALACAGIISRALLRGDEVRVVLVTCGDAYTSAKNKLESEYSYRAFDRDGDGDFDMLDYGIVRHGETISAMKSLGLDESDVVFLGYPDAGIDDLWRDIGIYTSPHTGASEVPESYDFARSVGNPYTRESILSDVKGVIREFRPTLLYSPRDTDHHQDHWATGRFVTQALTELREFRTWTAHYGYLVHWEANEQGWPQDSEDYARPSGHAPWDLQIPLTESSITAAGKESVINLYFSQCIASGDYLRRFSKTSEVFWLEGFSFLKDTPVISGTGISY